MAKGVKSIKGNASPKVGETNYYEVASYYPGTIIKNENEIKWKLFVQERNESWRELKGPQKTGKKVPYLLPEKWLGRKMLIEAYVYSPEKKVPSAIIITPVKNNIPTIDKVELLYVDDTKGSTFSFREKLRVKAYCTNMFNKELKFTLWEDDAKGPGHNAKNKPIETLPLKKVDKNGVAVGEFLLTKALMQKAMQGEADPKQLEFYVTVEYYVNKKHATDNIEINNPFPQTPKHTSQATPVLPKQPSKPAVIPKAKGSPAETKPISKKEEKGILEKVTENGKELWDWLEGRGTATKEQKPTVQKQEGKSQNQINSTEISTIKVCECEQYKLIWGNKVSCKFRKKVIAIAKELWIDDYRNMANNLMAVFAWETGETFKPDVPNRKKSGATGLIQFMPERATEYFGKCTIETVPNYFNSKDSSLHNLPRVKEFAEMKAEDQLDYVKKYFADLKGKKLEFVDFYLKVLFPASSGHKEHYVFGTSRYKDSIGLPTDSEKVRQKRVDKYAGNSGMDIFKDDRISKSEIALSIQPYITKGLPEIFRKGKKNTTKEHKKDISDVVVVTDAGHGINGDKGASVTKDTEAIMALEVESKTSQNLANLGIKNVRTRTSELNNVKENQVNYRTNVFKNNKGKVMVSHHLNSVGDTFLIMYHPDKLNIYNNPDFPKQGYHAVSGGSSQEYLKNSKALGNSIKTEIEAIGIKAILKEATVPHVNYSSLGILRSIDGVDNAGVLIEMGSVSQTNTVFLRNNSSKIGTAIANGIAKYLKVEPPKEADNFEECESESSIKPVESKPIQEQSSNKWHDPVDNPRLTKYNFYGNEKPSSGTYGYCRIDSKTHKKKYHSGFDFFAIPGKDKVYCCLKGNVHQVRFSDNAGWIVRIKIQNVKDLLEQEKKVNYKTQYADELKGIDIKETDDVYLIYMHLDSTAVTEEDAKNKKEVDAGAILGYAGVSGSIASGGRAPHLHLEVTTVLDAYGHGESVRTNPARFVKLNSYNTKDQDEESKKTHIYKSKK